VLCYLTKYELRGEEKGSIDLPSKNTKREINEMYCFHRGWDVKSDNKGRYPKVVDYVRRKVDAMLWKEDMASFDVCSWWSFRNIWKEHCSIICIRSKCNFAYGECAIFLSKCFSLSFSKVGKVDGEGKPTSDDEESQASVEAFANDLVVDDIKNFVDGDVGCVDACLKGIKQELILEAAGFNDASPLDKSIKSRNRQIFLVAE
jgi:hypothetical protein